MAQNKGYVKIHRSIMDQDDYNSGKFCRPMAWIHLIMIAQHKEGVFWKRGIKVKLTRGQIAVEISKLATEWKWSVNKVKRFIKDKQTDSQILNHKNNITTLLSILNYEKFQGSNDDDGLANELSKGLAENSLFSKNKKNTGSQNNQQKNGQTNQQNYGVIHSKLSDYDVGSNVNGLADNIPQFDENGLASGLANGLANELHLKNVKNVNNVKNIKKSIKKEFEEISQNLKITEMEKFLIAEMQNIYKKINPGYASDYSLDAPPLLKIAHFLAKQEGLTDFLGLQQPEFLTIWGMVATKVAENEFYARKSLLMISNHIQEFYYKEPINHQQNGNEIDSSGNSPVIILGKFDKNRGKTDKSMGANSRKKMDALRNWGSAGRDNGS